MCLILFAYQVHPVYKLVIAANRDESYERPTAPAYYWEDEPHILAGRDLEKMGTWMGVTKDGRFAALTNYRNPKESTEGKRSRGELVAEALKASNLDIYMKGLKNRSDWYPGYNLIAGGTDGLYYFSNIDKNLIRLEPGIYGVSNHLLDTEWPKVVKGKAELSKVINGSREILVDELFKLLQNSDPAPDDRLPQTGVSLELERILSPLFIKSEHYGTRSSTVLLMSNQEIQYIERVFTAGHAGEQSFQIRI
ncbi:NRDE family protein [Neobacillus muris]|uniref:NRDE family protein n=1 Tax=Neobacillus muris TaxID=2941334 RepID=UPI00203F4A5A|nr:NRDE family protein [Neobacillus muris]